MRYSQRFRILGLAIVAALASTASATADENTYTFRATAAGQEAARSVMLTLSDVGPGWKQSSTEPDLTNDTRCPYFHPRISDLVVTGATGRKFVQAGAQVDTEAEIMRTAEMVRTDWQRSVGSPNFLKCTRSLFRQDSNAKSRFISLRRLAFPPVATRTAAFRLVVDVTDKRGKARVVQDIVAIGHGRTELTLVTTMPLTSVSAMFPNELVWAKVLAGRAARI
jgi:hypothetical protein